MQKFYFFNSNFARLVTQICLILLLFVNSACSQELRVIQSKVNKAVGDVGCRENSSHVFDILNLYVEKTGRLPSTQQLEKNIYNSIQSNWGQKLAVSQMKELSSVYSNYFLEVEKILAGQTKEKILESLAAFEVGIVDDFQFGFQTHNIQNKADNIHAKALELGLVCPNPDLPPPGEFVSLPRGVQKAMSVAYQSCNIPQLAPIDVTARDLKGVKITGKHSDGVGNKREIESLEDLVATHYYLQNDLSSEKCFPIKKNPLIYDYGGKPFATAEKDTFLSFFKDSGSGTSVLGVDCSGYVFSVLAVSGRKIHPEKVMKATLVNGIPARAYMEPEKNGMPCFEKIMVGQSGVIRPGDFVASTGHIFIIDEIGSDPLGIFKVKDKKDCDKIKYKDFNFILSQSSPSIGGVGINRYVAADYFEPDSGQRRGIEAYAKKACEAVFDQTDILVENQEVQIVRHTGKPECLMPSFEFENQECVQTCLN